MERSFNRFKKLPAFRLDMAALRLLAEDISEVFPGVELKLSIQLSLKGEDLQFESIEELESYTSKLPAQVSDFLLSWSAFQNFRIFCRLMSSTFGAPMIYISVPNEVWCAGGIAVLEKHISRNARWYRFLRQWHFWLITFVVSSAPIIADKVFHRETLNDTVPLVLWAVSYVILLCPSGTPA